MKKWYAVYVFLYSYESTNQLLVNSITFDQFKFREMCVLGWTLEIILTALFFCNFTEVFMYDWQESPHTWLQ